MVTIKRIKQLAKLAGFKYSHEDDEHNKYVCFDHDSTNTCRILIPTEWDETKLLKILFEQCKRVGRIQVRQELAKTTDVHNYD